MLPRRKKNRLDSAAYMEYGAYFITICTANRKPIFWITPNEKVQPGESPTLSPIGKIVEAEIQNIPSFLPDISIEKYAIMPDHLHMVLFLHNAVPSERSHLSKTIQQFKGRVTKAAGQPVWQKSFYDHIIRGEREYQQIWKYIDENPMAMYMDKF